jgi:nucleoside-diphosphate-sugar epimerase
MDSLLLLDLLGPRIGRLVHLSTVSVYRSAASARVTEAAAVRWDDRDGDGYGARKAACERVVERAAASGGPPCVIVRAAPLLGAGDPVSREGFLVQRLMRREPILVPGDADATIVMLWVRDLAWALAEAAANPAAAGHSLHLAFAGSRSFAEHVQAIDELLGVEPDLRSVDPETLSARGMNPFAFPFAPLGGRAWVDCELARQLLGFEAAPYSDALRETVAWLRDLQPDARPAWPGRT